MAKDPNKHRPAAPPLQRFALLSILVVGILLGLQTSALAWPLDTEWISLTRNGAIVQDPSGDASKWIDIVSTTTDSAVYFSNDGIFLYFRIRLNGDPRQGGGLKSFGWGIEIDTDQDPDDYEWLVMCSGIPSTEGVFLEKNTVQGVIGQPSDAAELFVAQYPLTGYHQISIANTTTSGDADYFLDFKIPYAVFKSATGLTDGTAIRFIGGTSNSAQNLNAQGSDLIGSSGDISLYDGLGDYFTPTGVLPSSGSKGQVDFVKSLSGLEEATVITAGQNVYVRVEDADQTPYFNPGQTVIVTLTTSRGDREVITLTATGVAGKFTGQIPTSNLATVTTRDGTLQVLSGDTVTVTYSDVLTENGAAIPPIERQDDLLVTATGTDIRVTKSASTTAPIAGQTMTFTLEASNLGQITATNVSVTDLLPVGLTFVSANGNGTYTSATGLWNIGTINADATASITLTVTVNTGFSGALTNTATLSAVTPADVVPTNNSASVTITVGGADLALTKTVDKSTVTSGDQVVFTLTLRNYGPYDASSVVVRDLLPAGLAYVSHSGSGTYTSGTGDWTLASVPAGTVWSLNITATATGAAGTTLVNTASIFSSSRPDPVATNDNASATVTIGTLDLAVGMTVSNNTPASGSSVTYTVSVVNNGPANATNLQLRAQLDSSYFSVTSWSSNIPGATYTAASGLWNFTPLDSGQTATLTVTATVTSSTPITLRTLATLIAPLPDNNLTNNEAKVDIAVGGTDLRVTKTASNFTPGVGDTFSYIITLTNLGPRAATSITAQDILPPEVKYQSDTASTGSFNKSSGVWTVASLANGASATLTINVLVTGAAGALVTNNAFITAAAQPDPNQTNNIGSVQVAITGTDLAITKTVSNTSPVVGQDFTYTLTVTNNGPRNATNVRMRDLLPPELEYVSFSYTGFGTSSSTGNYLPATGIWESTTAGTGLNINTGFANRVSLTITARVLSGSTKQVITNTATIFSATQGDVVPGNNTASVDIFVNATDLAVTKTVSNPAPPVNEAFTYTVTVRNNGPNLVTNALIEDFQPVGVTFTATTPSTGTFALGRWNIPSLAIDATATLQITAMPEPGTVGTTVTNTATLASLDQVDTNSANNSASVNIVPTAAGNLSTSTKTVVDLNGGDVEVGDTLRYTISVIESSGSPAANVDVTDHIPANVSNFAVVSIPVGAVNGSTYAGTGANGSGYLNITGINVPANGTSLIVFDVQANGINGQTIANTAVINGTTLAVAPTLTIAASSVPVSGTKQLYLQAPDSENSPSIPQSLGRTPLTAAPNPIRVRIQREDTPVRWDLTPALQSPLSLNANTTVVLQLADSNANLRNLQLTLSYNAGAGQVILAQQYFAGLNIADITPAEYVFNLATPAITIPAGGVLQLTVDNDLGALTGEEIYIFPFSLFSGTPKTSRVELNSATVINIDSVGFFSDIVYPGGAPLASVSAGDTVRIRSTVSDPFGSFDITSAVITINNPLGTTIVNQAAMTAVFDSGTATKIYEYRYSVPASGPAGNWTVRVDAREGTEGLVSDFELETMSVAQPLPNLIVVKMANKAAAAPGETITYTITLTNSGPGIATNVVIDDRLGQFSTLAMDTFGSGKPFNFTDGATPSGYAAIGTMTYSQNNGADGYSYVPPATGFDPTITNWKMTMPTPMNGNGASFTIQYVQSVR